ncbi:uncharacterized protein ACA1_382890 [Acanthamoeba castellanii str. Neff]|uniref:TsaA-like domain-containing protein n=1 Tax=Acanthamoeba castellanii (strain ATCC 30010 / Neff) TaxID=1257118 RepID=L8GUC5_ACACF|nr:uncharacterized protein ACA1_382890 [Acanthamoeba castellanii str. Neff]ELR16789.1 hypothetical protein ACA1_382890 [Acanthamoeba castellanii str. Neff]
MEEGAAQLGHKRRRSEPKSEGEPQEQKRKGKKRGKKQKALTPLDHVPLQPIGLFESCFLERHGTPRQGLLVPSSRGKLTLRRSEVLTNPKDALIGLEGHSHVWIVFLFHNNVGNPKNRVQPPRLGGRKLGMLATRTPHRPCPIGLSVARVESIEGETLHLSGVDLVNNTPVLDIKPYIPRYDAITDAITAEWLVELDGKQKKDGEEDEQEESGSGRLQVQMSNEAVESLQRHAHALRFFKNDWERARRCIEEVLALDIRTLHMKRKHREGTYDVRIDVMNITFVVNTDSRVCTVQRIDLWPESYDYEDFNEVKKKRLTPASLAERPVDVGTSTSSAADTNTTSTSTSDDSHKD